MLLRPIQLCQCRSGQDQSHRSPIAGPLPIHVAQLAGDYRIVVWTEAHLSALEGDCWRSAMAIWFALSLLSRHPDKEKESQNHRSGSRRCTQIL